MEVFSLQRENRFNELHSIAATFTRQLLKQSINFPEIALLISGKSTNLLMSNSKALVINNISLLPSMTRYFYRFSYYVLLRLLGYRKPITSVIKFGSILRRKTVEFIPTRSEYTRCIIQVEWLIGTHPIYVYDV